MQTCDWPRNVVCVSGKRNGEITEFTESLKNDDGDGQDHERVPRLLVEDVNFGQKNVPVSWTSLFNISNSYSYRWTRVCLLVAPYIHVSGLESVFEIEQ